MWQVLNVKVNVAGLNRQFIPFYQPLWSPSRRQLEVKVIDCTHIRTNLRGAVCHNSILGIDKKAWEEVSLMRTTPLMPTLLEVQADGKVLDQQKDSFARSMFC